MENDLATAIAAKLIPLAPKAAVDPEQFQVEIYRWVDDNEQPVEQIQVTWMSRCTTQYQLQTSPDLGTWTNYGPVMAGTNGPLWDNLPLVAKQFYRLVWSPRQDSPTPQP